MDKTSNYVVDGYSFEDAYEYERAKKEYAGILKLKKGLRLDDVDEVYRLYMKLSDKRYFSTPVGIGFMHQLREYLEKLNCEKPVPPIAVCKTNSVRQSDNGDRYRDKYEKIKTERDKLIDIKKKLIIAVVALAITVIGMIFIVVTNDNSGYFNAEEKVLNKYSAWQERLQNWEQELIEREDYLDSMIK